MASNGMRGEVKQSVTELSIGTPRRIETIRWLKECVSAIVQHYPDMMGMTRSHEKYLPALRACAEQLTQADELLTKLQSSEHGDSKQSESRQIADYFQANCPDQEAINLLASLWEIGVEKNKRRSIFSAIAADPKGNLVDIVNKKSGNNLFRMIGIILQDVQVNQLDLRSRIFIPDPSAKYVCNPYRFLNDFAASSIDRTAREEKAVNARENKIEQKEMADAELHATIGRLIYIFEHMEPGVCKRKELNLLKALHASLVDDQPIFREPKTGIPYRSKETACRVTLRRLFQEGMRGYDNADSFIRVINSDHSHHVFHREIGLVLQDQFHEEVAVRKWDRRIKNLYHFRVPAEEKALPRP